MKFKIGDKVKFLNDIGEGTITKIVSESLVNVEIEDGFEVPTLVADLIKVQSDSEIELSDTSILELDSQELDEKIEEKVASIFNTDSEEYVLGNDNSNVIFALVPVFQGNTFIEALNTFLINDSNFKVLYTISKMEEEMQVHLDAGILDANTKISISSVNHKEFRKLLSYNIQLIHYTTRSYKYQKPLSRNVTLDPLTIIDPSEYKENEYFNEKAFLINLNDDQYKSELNNINDKDIEKSIEQKDKSYEKVEINKQTTDIEEVDLHIEEIVNEHRGLSNSEILEIQMSKFKITLEGALKNNVRRIVFIHGVGNGTLRYEIRKYIDNHYPRLKYQDASYKEYGYGATMVIIK